MRLTFLFWINDICSEKLRNSDSFCWVLRSCILIYTFSVFWQGLDCVYQNMKMQPDYSIESHSRNIQYNQYLIIYQHIYLQSSPHVNKEPRFKCLYSVKLPRDCFYRLCMRSAQLLYAIYLRSSCIVQYNGNIAYCTIFSEINR